MAAPTPRVLIYLLRRDLRLHDNPVFHELARLNAQPHSPYTHLLPVYVFPAQQVEVSGFLASGTDRSPYPEARSQLGHFWRCGHHRATFLAESVWALKQSLENVGSGLEIRVGMLSDVVHQLLAAFADHGTQVGGVWMTAEEGVEEKREERQVKKEAQQVKGCDFKLWRDEKYFVDDRDLPFTSPRDLPDIFTSFKKAVEPLRSAPRPELPTPKPSSLPPLPSSASIPPQAAPFTIPQSLNGLIASLHKPLPASLDLTNPPAFPKNNTPQTAIPFSGGAAAGHARLSHLLRSGAMTRYKDTRNGLLGPDFSSKLSAWLALGCLTAREVHWRMHDFEDGRSAPDTPGAAHDGPGFARGESAGSTHMRFELLWRDYFRLCTRKFGPRLFRAGGFKAHDKLQWSTDAATLQRWLEGSTGTGLVDAAQRELFLTGYTSNRTRQNVASYLAKHLGLDWRLGAEWYETMLVDYDVSSNWGNWQYTAGVGNDPREGGEGRKFNPVKQAGDYDPDAAYVKSWVEEVRGVSSVDQAWQCWKVPEAEREKLGLKGCLGAEQPLVRIEYNRRGGGKNGNGGKSGGGYQGGGRRGGAGGGRGKGRAKGEDRMTKRGAV